jgi:hypothetical protein
VTPLAALAAALARRVISAGLLAFGALLPGCVLLPTLSGAAPETGIAPPVPVGVTLLHGAVHCHSRWSHDATGRPERIVGAAREAGLDFVALTDHYVEEAAFGGPRGERDGVILLYGAEVRASGGSVLAIDLNLPLRPRARPKTTDDPFERVRAAGGLALIGHAERFRGWDALQAPWDGLEVANLHAMARRASPAGTLLAALALPPGAFLRRLVRHLDRRLLSLWDALGRNRRVPGWGGADAHENIRLFGQRGGVVASYHQTFRAVSNYVLARERSAQGVREALAAGRGWVAFELRASARGFRCGLFDAAGRPVATMGEERAWAPGLRLAASCPAGARLRLYRDGALAAEADGALSHGLEGPGVWRVEAMLDGEPFVLANPIYVRAAPESVLGR